MLNNEIDFIGDEYFGYILEKADRYLIWKIGGKLRITNLIRYYKLKTLNNNPNFAQTEWFLFKIGIRPEAYDDMLKFHERFEEHDRYNTLILKVQEFLEKLEDQQIFI